MPPIRNIIISDDQVQFTDYRGVTKTLNAADLNPNLDNTTKVENFVNDTWIPANVVGYQMKIHVFQLNPLRFTIGTWNLGMPIPNNWWIPLV